MEEKKFDKWIEVKKNLHKVGRIPKVNERDVWWAGCGQNVGVEINGKSERFTRPVVILRKFSRFGVMAIPLTSQKHEGSWWVEIEFLGKREWAVVSQARFISTSRLYSKIGQIPTNDMDNIREGFLDLFKKCSPPVKEG